MPTKHTRPCAESCEAPALALALLGLVGAGTYYMAGVVSVLLTRLAELPERLARFGEMGS